MENTNTIPLYVNVALESIDNDAMAISGLSRLVYELKLDAENMEDTELTPGLKRLNKGLDDCSIMRSIEVMADNIKVRLGHLEEYITQLHDGGEREMMQGALARDAAPQVE